MYKVLYKFLYVCIYAERFCAVASMYDMLIKVYDYTAYTQVFLIYAITFLP